MTQDNNGWGTPYVTPTAPKTGDGWGTELTAATGFHDWPAPADSADRQTSPPLAPSQAAPDDKPAPWLMPDDVASAYDTAGLDAELVQQSFSEIADEKLLYESTDQDRAEAANACAGTNDEWFVDIPDGELTRAQIYVPTVHPGEDTGFYVAYSQGILHAVLAGPYPNPTEATAGRDRAWAKFQADPNFALAFDRAGFNPHGLYVAEIPLKARRRGAYGPI